MKTSFGSSTILERIVSAKAEEIATRKLRVRPQALRDLAEAAVHKAEVGPPRGLLRSLSRGDTVAVIAEVKRKSPSKGWLSEHLDAQVTATQYERGGAAAVSVLTDEPFFGGSSADLRVVRGAVRLPVLRKDFILDDYQIDEARVWGADAVLLIVSVLDDDLLQDLLGRAHHLGMDALVEVHTEEEFERALSARARLIGINNRDLQTFATALDVSLRLARLAPPDIVLVSESGIRTRQDVVVLANAGIDAILVGESFIRSTDPEAAAAALTGVPLLDRVASADGRPEDKAVLQ